MPNRASQAVEPKLKQWREFVRKVRVGVLLFGFAGCGFCQSTIRSSAIPPLRSDVLSKWTTDQGLAQDFVTSLAQTPDGFLWVGTLNGLLRFDGVNFRSFTNVGPPEMQDDIRWLFPDETGGLWISTNTGLFQYQQGRFTHRSLQGIMSDEITLLDSGRHGDLCITGGQYDTTSNRISHKSSRLPLSRY